MLAMRALETWQPSFFFLRLLICFLSEHSAGRVMMQCVPSAAICLMFEFSSVHNACNPNEYAMAKACSDR